MTPDVAIVGAGPAGAWAAHQLASAGASVVLFDHSHPREKPCGGGLTARALELVADALDSADLPLVVASTARFTADTTRREATVSLPGGPLDSERALAIASRRDFDLALFRASIARGARHVAERVVDVRCDQQGVTIQAGGATYRAGLILGADGANSLVRRRVHRPFTRSQLSVATGFFVAGVTSQEIAIHSVSRPAGYIWSFPRTDHVAIGVCARADEGVSPASLRELTRSWGERSGVAGAGWTSYSWPIPTLSPGDLSREPVAGSRWMLVGDAAGLVDPLTREGIFFALKSAELAALAALEGSAPERTYEARIRDELHPELRRAALMARGFFQPGFMRLLLRALEESARIRAVMRDLIAGRQPYRGLGWRLLATGELGLAASVLHLKWGKAGGTHFAR